MLESPRLLTITHQNAPASATSVAQAGDINNDGFSDVLLGYSSTTEHERGGFYVLFGGPLEEEVTYSDTHEVDAWSVAFEPSDGTDYASLGWKVGTATDINHDGFHDIFVTAPLSNHDGGETYEIDRGLVNLYFGPIDAGEIDPLSFDVQLHGRANEHVGYDVAFGNVSGTEQVSVLVAGLRYLDTTTGIASLPAFLFTGPFSERTVSTEDSLVLLADQSSTQLASWDWMDGGAIELIDLNGDGMDDLVRGAPGERLNQSIGHAYVLSGMDILGLEGVISLSTVGTTILSGDEGDHLGCAVQGLDDQNGDGYADLAIGAPLSDHTGLDAGAVFILSGGPDLGSSAETSTDQAYLTFWGHADHIRLGTSIGGLADVDSDGLRDILLIAAGALEEETLSTSYVFYYATEGTILTSESDAHAIIGAVSNNSMGSTAHMSTWVEGLGDGCDDLILGNALIFGGTI